MKMYKFLLISSFVVCSRSHVALKYPPARKYDLDFLDSFRTVGSCGMNPGNEITQFQVGDQINVTWHLGYPHGGGIKLQILRDGSTEDLIPDWDSSNRVQQSSLVTLPDTPCTQCTLLLLRQATEWGGSYQFRSCSDISLVPAGQLTSPACSGHGQLTGGSCSCSKDYTGDRCQYKTECSTDSDCGAQGKCELLNNALFEEKACFCQKGYFGEKCSKSVDWTDGRGYDESKYTAIDTASSDRKVMWKMLDNEKVEVIAEFSSKSYVALGWRPADSTKSCQRFPEDAPAPKGSDFHAMDCTDMVIGFAKNGRGWIRDFYTRDRSTPRVDNFWGGEDDLINGDVWEVDGKTIMRFTKKMEANCPADHPFQGRLHVIWATGQQEDDFYKNDQLKYHGREQRGIFVIDGPEIVSKSLHPAVIGVIIAVSVLLLLMLIQVILKLTRME